MLTWLMILLSLGLQVPRQIVLLTTLSKSWKKQNTFILLSPTDKNRRIRAAKFAFEDEECDPKHLH